MRECRFAEKTTVKEPYQRPKILVIAEHEPILRRQKACGVWLNACAANVKDPKTWPDPHTTDFSTQMPANVGDV